MAVNVFGITPESVRAHCFPNADAWTAASRPSEATVTTIVLEEGAKLQGRLLKESISAASITDTAGAPYLMCAEQLRLMAAIRVARSMLGTESELAKGWRLEVADFFEQLERDGETFLGDDTLASGTSDADGPTSFIGEYGLSVGDTADASSAEPYLRRDDVL